MSFIGCLRSYIICTIIVTGCAGVVAAEAGADAGAVLERLRASLKRPAQVTFSSTTHRKLTRASEHPTPPAIENIEDTVLHAPPDVASGVTGDERRQSPTLLDGKANGKGLTPALMSGVVGALLIALAVLGWYVSRRKT